MSSRTRRSCATGSAASPTGRSRGACSMPTKCARRRPTITRPTSRPRPRAPRSTGPVPQRESWPGRPRDPVAAEPRQVHRRIGADHEPGKHLAEHDTELEAVAGRARTDDDMADAVEDEVLVGGVVVQTRVDDGALRLEVRQPRGSRPRARPPRADPARDRSRRDRRRNPRGAARSCTRRFPESAGRRSRVRDDR